MVDDILNSIKLPGCVIFSAVVNCGSAGATGQAAGRNPRALTGEHSAPGRAQEFAGELQRREYSDDSWNLDYICLCYSYQQVLLCHQNIFSKVVSNCFPHSEVSSV